MTYGHLTVACGPMYAGKTTELLRSVLWARNGLQRRVLVVKPAFDDRYSTTEIMSHDGLSTTAHSIREWDEVRSRALDADILFFDEGQFFQAPYFEGDLREIVPTYLRLGKEIMINGLDMDAHGEPFPIMAHALAMADEVKKLRAYCSVCGRPATKTFKTVADDKKVELGAKGLYEPRCNEHWTVLR
jgi:thymidine kinase